MAITAALVKQLRQRTGVGMMECKRALVEADGDIELAIENMRKSGQAKAAKKAGRIAAEGVIIIKRNDEGTNKAVMVEVNSETDFVAKDAGFLAFAEAVAERVLATDVAGIGELMALPLHEGESTTIEEARHAIISKIGENINVRRFERIETSGIIGAYSHGSRIGVVAALQGGNDILGKDIAMHIAASSPVCIAEADVPTDLLEKEREIIIAQSRDSGKPENIIEKMVEGRLRKYLAEVTLLGQAFVKDPDTTVGKLLKANNADVAQFMRFEVGDGIEKKKENFADEVMAQVTGG